MKRFKTCVATLAVACVLGGASFASDNECTAVNVEAYAHPSLFGAQTFEYSTDDGAYIKGGDIVKSNGITVKGKKNVMVKTWAEGVLSVIKSNYADSEVFNPKMPILRSEWAVVLAEGFNLSKNEACTKKYTDIKSNYWATGWICGALDSDLMIGYPEKVFKPDQPITKAEVFATIAKIVNAAPSADDKALLFKGQKVEYIPTWANDATAEVLATRLLEEVPDSDKVITAEYLTKEQVAYLIGALRTDLAYYQTLAIDSNAPAAVKNYAPVAVSIKLDDRLSAKTSNIGDHFTAKTTKEVTIKGINFPVKSRIDGRVVEVVRPGLNNDNAGYIKVKFLTITNTKTKESLDFPKNISEATSQNQKSPFFLGRVLGFPLSGSGRVLGVVGRTGGAIADTCGNRLEELGDNWSNVFVETLSGHPGTGAKSFAFGGWTIGKGVYDIAKEAVSGTFGVVYEAVDELIYVFVPSLSNDSSLNPNEELVIVF